MGKFERGNRVKVIDGSYKGRTGYVVEAFEPNDDEEYFTTKQSFLVRLSENNDINIHEDNLIRDTSSEAFMEETMYLTEKANAHNPEFKTGDVVSAPAPDDKRFKELYVVKECMEVNTDNGIEYRYKASPVSEYLSHLEKTFDESEMIYRWYDKSLAKKFTESVENSMHHNVNDDNDGKKKFNSGDKVRIIKGKEEGYTGVVLEVEHNKFHDSQYVVYLNETKKHSLYSSSMMELVENDDMSSTNNNNEFSEGDKVRITSGEEKDYIGVITMVFNNSLINNDENQYAVFLNETQRSMLCYGHMMEPVDDKTFMESKTASESLFMESNEEVDDSACKAHMGGKLPREIRQRDPKKPRMIIAVDANDDTGIPHFHVFKSKKDLKRWTNSACLMFTDNSYIEHGDHRNKLDKDELDGVVKHLKIETADDIVGKDIWEYLIQLWNINNESNTINADTPMPDYNCRTIKSYTESVSEDDVLDDDSNPYEESDELSNILEDWYDYAPDSVNIDNVRDFLMEMAEIYPHYNIAGKCSFKMFIGGRGEGNIPHVHICYEHKNNKNHGKNKNNKNRKDRTVAYVCLGKNEYAPQHDKETKILNSKERKELVNFFNTKVPNRYGKDKNGEVYQLTCWQEAVILWENSYGKQYGMEQYFEVDEETGLYVMPDYSEINLPKKNGVTTESASVDDIFIQAESARKDVIINRVDRKETDDYEDILNESLEESEDYDILNEIVDEPSFRVGDVVNIYDNPDNLYVIKEVIETDSGFMYGITPLDDTGTYRYAEYVLRFQYHDSNYEQYFTESVENGLPAWRGQLYDVYTLYVNPKTHKYGGLSDRLTKEYNNDTIPPERMEHILHDHSMYDRIDDVTRYAENKKIIARNLNISVDDVKRLEDSVQQKINARNIDFTNLDLDSKKKKFTTLEYQFVGEIDKLDRKDHYPVDMTNLQIMQAIKEAYSNANKIRNRKFQSSDDQNGKSAPRKGKILYEGISKNGMIIQFLYNFDLDYIETAYPVTSDRSKKH